MALFLTICDASRASSLASSKASRVAISKETAAVSTARNECGEAGETLSASLGSAASSAKTHDCKIASVIALTRFAASAPACLIPSHAASTSASSSKNPISGGSSGISSASSPFFHVFSSRCRNGMALLAGGGGGGGGGARTGK